MLTFYCLFLDSVDYIADAVLCSPRWTNKGGKEAYEVGNVLFSLENGLFILADFFRFKLK